MDKNHDVIIFISKYVYFNKEAGLANAADIIEIAMILIETTYEDLIKVKRIKKNVLESNFYLHFLININSWFLTKNANASRTLKGYVRWSIHFFSSSLGKI